MHTDNGNPITKVMYDMFDNFYNNYLKSHIRMNMISWQCKRFYSNCALCEGSIGDISDCRLSRHKLG